MSAVKFWKLTQEFSPAAVGSNQTKKLFSVAKGTRVWAASYEILTPADGGQTQTCALGDSAGTASYIAAVDLTGTPGVPTGGSGAYLNPSGGKVYGADTTIDALFAQTSGTGTVPRIAFTIHCTRDVP